MAVNKELWLTPNITDDSCPEWICPTCSKGILIVEDKTIQKFETKESLQDRDHPDWEPYWIRYTFAAPLKCNNTKCKDTVFVTGTGSVEEGYQEIDEDWYSQYYDSFKPIFFTLSPNIFTIEEACPTLIQSEIKKSFSLFFCDTHSCANKIRASIELLMNEFKIPSTKIQGKKRISLSLHARIVKFGIKYPESTNALLAIKWIGNAGSHISDVEKSDLIDAYDILEYVLNKIFSKNTKEINKVIKEINKRKAPRSKNKRNDALPPPF
ncbi:DUF4145 domain-containing protein [Hymenobacter sp. BT507]|uniref:DUF4145 domain-containing protein n=1 Tax=Hymenobacter citatus TaxID=2763506 RepID=A0ABR7MI92_9BACT|nr:DUF4145 domain-containing protein [Hymenobacter citatus]MBC6610816.1 DUF4145 domain-containing protein [Hymenobacter citatus]